MRLVTKFGNRKREFDTDKATEVGRKAHGSFGDPAGYEEVLYQMPSRLYFIYGVGGPDSCYPKPTITPVTKGAGLEKVGV